MENIEGKVVVITGASSGIGKATAKQLVKNGAKVVLGARREEQLKAIVTDLGEENAAYQVADVTKPADMQKLVNMALDRFGKVDVFFANAGVMPAGNVSELNTKSWDLMVDINIKGVLNSIAAVYPVFKENNVGQFIVTSSMAGLQSVPGNAVYSGTKHFVRAFVDSFRAESAQEKPDIRTTIIYPGAVKTELLNSVAPSVTKDQVAKFYEQVGIEPIDIANAVTFAVSQPKNVDISDIAVQPSRQG